MINTLIYFLKKQPLFGSVISTASGVYAILDDTNVVLGTIAVLLGIVVGFYTLRLTILRSKKTKMEIQKLEEDKKNN